MMPIALGRGQEPLTILCIGAHCDDIEIGCGGTVLRLLKERPGSRVHWVVLASNPRREAEARSSASEFLRDASESMVVVKAFRESYFPYIGAEIKDFFEELKQSVVPDVIFSHHRGDEHQDHRTLAQFTWNTFRDHTILEYEIHKYEGDLGHPSLYVPLDETTVERKVALLLEHFPSQLNRSWFRADTFRGVMAVRGVECNSSSGFAEALHVRKLTM